MRVVDTSAWIEWLAGSPTGESLASEIPSRREHVVQTIVQYEFAVWASRELSEAQIETVTADTIRSVVVPLSTEIALRAAEVRRSHKLATADAIIYATALAQNADLLTCDAHFEGLPAVIYVPKA